MASVSGGGDAPTMDYELLGIDVFGVTEEARLNPRIFQCWFLHLKALHDILVQEASALPDSQSGKLLDLGSGDSPPYHILFEDKVGQITTLDPFAEKADIRDPVEKIPLTDESVDYILATQVLEHIKNPFVAVGEMARVLKKGGVAFVSTHGLWEIHRLPKDYWRFTPDSLEELFKEFREVRILPNGGAALCLCQLINIAARPLFRGILKLLLVIFWTVINILGLTLDRFLPNGRSFVINYLVVARK